VVEQDTLTFRGTSDVAGTFSCAGGVDMPVQWWRIGNSYLTLKVFKYSFDIINATLARFTYSLKSEIT
jgi:hypothetical protein